MTPAARRFDGKVALVTGGASGIGEATARRFGAEGAAVIVADIDGEGAERVARTIVSAGGLANAFVADISRPDDVEAMIRHAVEGFGRLDVLHNNATSGAMALVADMSVEDWGRTIAVNLTAHFLATRSALPVMVAQGGGAIVNMSSAAALSAEEGLAAYASAKAGLIALTRNTAAEYARHNVRVNCICPGAILTPPTLAFIQAVEGVRERMERANPMRRIGTADEVASLVLYLASDEASFVTGAVYVIDGGATATASVGLMGGEPVAK